MTKKGGKDSALLYFQLPCHRDPIPEYLAPDNSAISLFNFAQRIMPARSGHHRFVPGFAVPHWPAPAS
jgi:hypothetical protein